MLETLTRTAMEIASNDPDMPDIPRHYAPAQPGDIAKPQVAAAYINFAKVVGLADS